MKIKFEPPYYIVIFSFKKTKDLEGYAEKAILLNRLVKEVEGFLGVEDYSIRKETKCLFLIGEI